MKRFLLILLLLLPCEALGATKYVDGAGSNTSPYDTWVKAAPNLDTVMDGIADGDIVVIGAGSYASTSDVGGVDNITVRAATVADGDPAKVGTVTIASGALSYWVYFGSNSSTWAVTGLIFNITGGNGRLFYVDDGVTLAGLTITDCIFTSCVGPLLYGTGAITNVLITGCTFTNCASLSAGISDGILQNSTFTVSSSETSLWVIGSGKTLTVQYCLFRGGKHSAGNERIFTVNGTLNAYYNQFLDYEDGSTHSYIFDFIKAENNSTISIYNNWFGISARNSIRTGTSVIANVKNNVFSGGHGFPYGGCGIAGGDTAISLTNNYIGLNQINDSYPSLASPNGSDLGSATDGGSNLLASLSSNMDLGIITYGKPHGYICLSIDDIEEVDYLENAASIAELWQSKGIRGTLYWNYGSRAGDHLNPLYSDYYNRMNAVVSAGYAEWGNHSWSHSGFDGPAGGAYPAVFSLQMKATYTGSVSFDGTTFSIDASDNSCDFSADVTTASYDTITELYNAINAAPYTTCITISSKGDPIQSTSIETLAAVEIPVTPTAAKVIRVDAGTATNRFFVDEITDTQNAIEAAFGTKPRAYAYPGGKSLSQALVDWFETNYETVGIGAGRRSGTTKINSSAEWANLRNIALYEINTITVEQVLGPVTPRNASYVRAYGAALANRVKATGEVIAFLIHPYAMEISVEEWGWLIDGICSVDCGVIKTEGDVSAIVRAIGSGWTSNDGGERWTTTFTDQADYRLQPGSPCIGMGTNVGLTTDYAGNSIRGMPDIGAYEYITRKGLIGLDASPRTYRTSKELR